MKKYIIDKADKDTVRTQVGMQVDRTKKVFDINELDGGTHWLKGAAQQQQREKDREQLRALRERKRQVK